MATTITELDAHEQPSDVMKAKWKAWSKREPSEFVENDRIDDPRKPLSESGFVQAASISAEQLNDAFTKLTDGSYTTKVSEDIPVIHHPILPGLLIIPNMIPPEIQTILLEKMLHRDLSNPTHQTNLHLHYTLPYPENAASFFSMSPDSEQTFTPKDPSVHRKLTARQVLQRRLHWVTLGGQYDWTNRVYPEERPPTFPPDISAFLDALFPDTDAQAAIVNFYTPGDTMMMHRDVSEFTDRGLVSLSLGCDGLFMIAPNGWKPVAGEESAEKEYLLLRLRSGDAIYMTQESRYAWHGVPKVLPGTCPEYLENWPAKDGEYADWEGWMKNKRINLNVRQMHE